MRDLSGLGGGTRSLAKRYEGQWVESEYWTVNDFQTNNFF